MYSGSHFFHPNDFSKTVLSWTFETLSKPLDIAMEQAPLPKNEQNIARFYQNFLPFILEESRAIIANGLEKVEQHNTAQLSKRNKNNLQKSEARPFKIVLKKSARLPKNEGNPLSMTFKGMIPKDIDHGSSMIVLLLKAKNSNEDEMSFIALGTENPQSSELFVKIIISSYDYDDFEECFEFNYSWQAHYLGSVVSEQRMYDACLEATDIPCVQEIASANIKDYSATRITTLVEANHLNLSQKKAICAFMNAKENSTLLLQGPPGTGKTTTLVCLLKQLVVQEKRTLVSAHSNKGVQVLALRALEKMSDVPMILLGVESKLNDKLRPIFLDTWHDTIHSHLSFHLEQIEQLAADPTSRIHLAMNDFIADIASHIQLIQQTLIPFDLIYLPTLSKSAKAAVMELTVDPFLISDFQHLENIIDTLRMQPRAKRNWQTLLDILNRLIGKWESINEEELKDYLLDNALIVFSTLISAGRKSMLNMAPIDFLLVDEAAQSVEAATLIPMRFQPTKVLLVGDTKQLPATVISTVLDDSDRSAERSPCHYQWSMMWRLIEENRQPSLMLTIQYRMHPQICQWPSSQYYDNRLITSPRILPMPLLGETGLLSRPYAIYTVSGQVEQRNASRSVCNVKEAQYVIKIIDDIRRQNKHCSIGVVTPYVAQKQLINESLTQKKHLLPRVDVNTVDGFQGDERDVIIISFTRTHVSEFLKEFRRLNVAITRAKACLIIVCASSLLSNDIGQLMADARLRKVLHSEQELNALLTKGVLPVMAQPSVKISLQSSAWQGNTNHQFDYAKSMEKTHKANAFLWYRRAAENNHPQAQYYVSQCYLSGHFPVEQDVQLGIDWLEKAAKQALPLAQHTLGQHFISGQVIKKNLAAGIAYCEAAADAGLIEAIVFLGQCYEEGTGLAVNISRAQNYYRQAAKLDCMPAILKLAALLAQGSANNKREAIKWYRKMAAGNETVAYYPLATLLNKVVDNQTEAFKWYLKAAENDHTDAQYELGLRFKQGLPPCTVDTIKSADFFRQAALAGHANAQFRYASCLKAGEGVEKNEREAMVFFKPLADDYNHAESQFQYALLTDKQAPNKAYPYYLKAARQNHGLAQYACIEYQINSGCDLTICLDFCTKLASKGHIDVLFILARLLDSGITGKIDKKEAYAYYRQALNNGHTLAHYYCAIALEEGKVVNQNYAVACEHYEECLEDYLESKPRLARLLLQGNDYQAHEIRAVELIKSYYYITTEKKPLVNLSPLESGVERLIANRSKSTEIFSIDSINTDSIYANHSLARMLIEGTVIPQDLIKAMKFFKKAADCGHIESCYEWALLMSQASPDKAYIYFKKAALQDHELAQFKCIDYQLKNQFDLDSCLVFCEKLAVQSLPLQFVLARLLDTGIAGKTDKLQAYNYYFLLAENHHPLAQYYCAVILEEGLVVQKDLVKVRQYYESSSQHFFQAKFRFACFLFEQSSENTEKKTRVSLTKDQIHGVALLKFYYDHYQDDKVFLSDNLEQNVECLLLASSKKQFISSLKLKNNYPAKANYLIGKIFQEGKGVEMSHRCALKYYQLAHLTEPDAAYRMGYIYESGQGVIKDVARAKTFYKNAADRGHPLAAKRLTWSYSLFTRNNSVPDDVTLMQNKDGKCLIS